MSFSYSKVLPVYAVTVNVAGFGLFLHDKNQAVSHNWRVPEKTLQVKFFFN
jgi:uncharacterized membrane protein YsdA (DUF1294 family)